MKKKGLEKKKLNLGCGAFKKDGYVNVDISRLEEPDVVVDLNVFPYPFEDAHFDLVEANHVLEHLDDPFRAMGEIHRVLANGGRAVIKVPHFSRGFTHPQHKRGFDISFPLFFQKGFGGGFTGTEFDVEKVRLIWFDQEYLKRTVLPAYKYCLAWLFGKVFGFLANLDPQFCSRCWCFYVGGFDAIEFVLVKVRTGK